MASDGAADIEAGKASFAWVLSDQRGQIVAKCAGPVYGLVPTSYRAEAYGILSPTCLLRRLLEFFGRQTMASYVHLCDNESATDKSAKCLEYEGWYPNDTLGSDWDVIQQIEEAFRAAITVPTMEHIKSHQDKKRAIETLDRKSVV